MLQYQSGGAWGYASVRKEFVRKRLSRIGSGGVRTVYQEAAIEG